MCLGWSLQEGGWEARSLPESQPEDFGQGNACEGHPSLPTPARPGSPPQVRSGLCHLSSHHPDLPFRDNHWWHQASRTLMSEEESELFNDLLPHGLIDPLKTAFTAGPSCDRKGFLYWHFLKLNNTPKSCAPRLDSDPRDASQAGGRRVDRYFKRGCIFLVTLAGPSRDL